MNEPLRADIRPRISAGHWYESQWSVFWTIVGAILTAGAIASLLGWLIVLAIANGLKVEFDKSAASNERAVRASALAAQARAAAEAEYRRPITVAPRSVDDCLAETGGVANEHYARCRRGYIYTP